MEQWDSIVFDCDGVILQSNRLKTEAFRDVLSSYDTELVTQFVEWHMRTGGVSRYEKFKVFFRDTLGSTEWELQTENACNAFGSIVAERLKVCPLIPGFEEFFRNQKKKNIPMSVNTGGAQYEVRAAFRDRGLESDFKTILGSPSTKFDNMKQLLRLGLVTGQSVYFGDSELDFDLASEFGLLFVFVEYESEWLDGRKVTSDAGGLVISDFYDLCRAR